MGLFLLVPNPATLASLTAGSVAALGMETTPSIAESLRMRRSALQDFARALQASAAGVAATAWVDEGKAAPEGGAQILEALGALIVDSDEVDIDAARASFGVEIYENVEVPLVEPEPADAAQSEEAAPADRWHLDNIAVEAARAKGLDGRGVLVGVLDTGIDSTHPEFSGKTIFFQEFDAVGARVPGGARDAGDHGTHVCGLIAGETVGVAPAADLAVAAVLTGGTPARRSGSLAQVARGLNWLLATPFRGPNNDPGVDILNASLGGGGYNSYLYSPLATARLATGDLMVAAIGNGGRSGRDRHISPANYDTVVGVGAVDRLGRPAAFSDWGSVSQHGGLAKPDIAAPGVAVSSSVPGGTYSAKSGTSMASPLVAGAGALLIQQSTALSGNASRLEKAILSLTRPPAGPKTGRGILDLSTI